MLKIPLKLNKKNITRLLNKSLRQTKDDILLYIDDNWTDKPFIESKMINGRMKRVISHEVSSPGTAPSIQSEQLRKSISGEVIDKTIYISSDKDYAVFLELGTKDMEPRPFFHPALNRSFDFFKKNMLNNFK